jgi:hypothetical protein
LSTSLTDRHVLFPILPIAASMQRTSGGRPLYACEPDKGAQVEAMKRSGSTF